MIRFFEEVRKSLLGGLCAKVGDAELKVNNILEDTDGITCNYCAAQGVSLTVHAKVGCESLALFLDAKC